MPAATIGKPSRMRIGISLSSEELAPRELVRQAKLAEEAGFQGIWLSDHFHPWNDAQGHSPFIWSTIGAIAEATRKIPLTTAVTCPTVRIHPAIIAQAAATSACLLEGRFVLGLGSGEALNEHILGDRWPEASERLEMLREAVEVIRLLWSGGFRSFRGRHYRVENARVYDLPEKLPPILISAFGEKALAVAADIGDGFVTTSPAKGNVERFRSEARRGRLIAGGTKVCWAPSVEEAQRTAHRLWATLALPGELSQVLPTPRHFEQVTSIVTEELVAEQVPCGPDLEAHFEVIQSFAEAGFDELYIQQIGSDERFFEIYASEVLPRLE